MRKTHLGGSEIEASVVGLGTWAIGGWMWGGTKEREAIMAIQAAIDAGCNLVDTAPAYGFGLSEELVGKAVRGRRDQVVLASKCGLVWDGARGEHFFDSGVHRIGEGKVVYRVYRCLRPDSLRHEVELSLQRMRVDCIDVMQTHWQDPTTPIEDTMSALMDLRSEGKIRAIGCSNATPAQMDAYRACGALDVDQEHYSMLDRAHEGDNLPYCARNEVAFLAYSPLAQGLLTGNITPDREFPEGDQRRENPRFSVDHRRRVSRLLDEFKPIAQGHGITISQLVIAWTVHQPGCTHALVGARTPEQARANAAAGDVTLSAAELATMAAAIRRHEASAGA